MQEIEAHSGLARSLLVASHKRTAILDLATNERALDKHNFVSCCQQANNINNRDFHLAVNMKYLFSLLPLISCGNTI